MIGKVYTITEKETGQIIYVGSTILDKLCKRMQVHYHDWFTKKVNHALAQYIRSKCSSLPEYHEKFEHKLIREYVITDKKQLHKIEERWNKHLNPLCNERKAYVADRKAYMRDYLREYMRQYRASKKLF